MKKIVILGAGFAGLHIFYKLRHLIGHRLEITLIDAREQALLKPSLPEVALEGAALSHSLVDLKHTIETKGGTFIHDEIVSIDAANNLLHSKTDQTIAYDYLFITLGAKKDYDAIKGFSQYGYSVCDDTQAEKLWRRLQTFEGGNIVTGAAKSTWGTRVDAPKLLAPCEGPIGEVMFMLDHYLLHEKRKQRKKDYEITVFTAGEVFFEDVGDTPREVVGKIMQERDMTLHTQKVLTEIGKDFIAFEDGSRMPCDLAIVIPPYAAPEVLKTSGIGDEKGFIPTDEGMRHLDYPNIFAAGDNNAMAQPKLGHIAIIQGSIAAASLMKELGEEITVPPYQPEVFCIMNMGGHDATLIVSDVLYGGTTDKAIHSPFAHIMKWGFDSYVYFNRGNMPPDFAMDMTDKLIKLL